MLRLINFLFFFYFAIVATPVKAQILMPPPLPDLPITCEHDFVNSNTAKIPGNGGEFEINIRLRDVNGYGRCVWQEYAMFLDDGCPIGYLSPAGIIHYSNTQIPILIPANTTRSKTEINRYVKIYDRSKKSLKGIIYFVQLPGDPNAKQYSYNEFSDINRIVTYTPSEAMEYVNFHYTSSDALTNVIYYDGLGRPMQEVAVTQSPARTDIIRSITYDALGREDKTYLPYQEATATNGACSYFANQSAFYKTYRNATDAPYAYAQKVFDGSPLNRVVESAAPGNNWRVGNGHTSKIAYSSNAANTVRLWTVDAAGQAIHSNAYYAANTLYVTETTDEDGKKTREYRDKQDRVVESHIDNLRTAYVYNDLGQLAAIIPPKAYNLAVTDAEFKDLIFNYIYDGRGRVIASKTPGAVVAYKVYDTRDRLVMSQDGVQRTSNKWTVYKYDALNRPLMEGVVSTTATQATLIAAYANTAVNETQTAENYSFATVANAPTLTANGVLKWTYYDDYAWLPSSLAYVAGGFNFAYTGYLTSVKGQITGTKTKVLDGNEETASGQVLRSAVFYDNKYRPVQTVSENYAGGGTTRISTRFSFDGLPEAVLETQVFGSATNTIAKRMEYDHARRLLKEYHKINAQVEVLLTENGYDELGKLKSKKQNTVETVNYAYNIRDWLTSAKASKFSIDLTYNFNGNIATQIAAGSQYAYTYDAANRLTAGTHSGGFTENGITYDANGNIATLNRVGTSPGAFTYSYTGNKLTSLKVNTTPYAYTYDANGNATKDGYRGMELQYNLLNLPRKVSKGTGSVEYVYLASGAKLAKKVNGAFTQFYNGSVVYKGDKTAEYISTSEGLAMKTASGFAYQYNLSDHLGNVRVVLNQDKSVAQSTNYYPFGLAHATSALEKNKYLYNGKEIQNDLIGGTAFGMLDYGARFYDPVIGRWHSIDPLASKYAGLSGYNYGLNNPVMMIDPDGMDPDGFFSKIKNAIEDFFLGNMNNPPANLQGAERAQYQLEELEKGGERVQSATEYIDNLGEVVAAVNPLGTTIKNAVNTSNGREVSGGDMAFSALEVLPVGVVSKIAKVKVGTTVLGHYPEYVKLAEKIGATTFQIPLNVWNKMSAAEQWTANVKFLDRMIRRGDNIKLATPLNQVKPGSFYQKELRYLFDKGYKISSEGSQLIK